MYVYCKQVEVHMFQPNERRYSSVIFHFSFSIMIGFKTTMPPAWNCLPLIPVSRNTDV